MKTQVVSTQACKYTSTQVHKSTSKRFPEWRKDFLRRRLQRPTLLDLAPLPCLAASDVTKHQSTNKYSRYKQSSMENNRYQIHFIWCNQAQKYQRVRTRTADTSNAPRRRKGFKYIFLQYTCQVPSINTCEQLQKVFCCGIWYNQWPKYPVTSYHQFR